MESQTVTKVTAKTQGFLDQLNQNWCKKFITAKTLNDRIALLQNYNIQTQKEEAIIQFLLDRLNPPKISITHESQVRAALEEIQKKGEVLISPEAEKIWQDKITEAIQQDHQEERTILQQHYQSIKEYLPEVSLEDFFPEAKQVNPFKKEIPVSPPVNEQKIDPAFVIQYPDGLKSESPLSELKGLGAASIERLEQSNVFTIGAYFALTFEKATEIIKSPLVTARHRDYFNKTIQQNNSI